MEGVTKKGAKPFETNPLGDESMNIYRRGGWRGQLARVRRWHVRLRTAAPDDHLDFLYAFFQNCNHLGDWVSSDAPVGAARAQKLVADTVELRVCRDICNATKHFTLNDPPKVKGGFAGGREYRPVGWPTDHPAGLPMWFIAGGVKYDALDLADRCLAAWEGLAADMAEIPSSV
jgi:hypothetical protein